MLYHREIGFPKTLQLPLKEKFNLNYAPHALEEAKADRYGKVNFPTELVLEKYSIIEVETEDNVTPTKILVRVKHCDKNDMCLAFIPQTGRVKTVWLNRKSDRHITLDRSKYDRFKN